MKKKLTYTEQIKEFNKELKLLRIEGSFDTVYTSVLVLGIATIITILLSVEKLDVGLKFFLIILGIIMTLSLIMQFLSVFFGRELKKISLIFILGTLIWIILILSYVPFPNPPIRFSSFWTWIRVIIFMGAYLLVYSLVHRFFEKLKT